MNCYYNVVMEPGTLVKLLTVVEQPLGLVLFRHRPVLPGAAPDVYSVQVLGWNGPQQVHDFRPHQMEIINANR